MGPGSMMAAPVSRGEFVVDVRGASLSAPELRCRIGGIDFRFVADPALKTGLSFHLGAFFSKAVLSDDAFMYPWHQRIAVLTESPIDASYRHIPSLERRYPLIFTHQCALLAQGGPFQPLMFGTNWIGVSDEAATVACLAERPSKSAMVSFIGSLLHPDAGAYRFRREIAEYAVSRGDVDCFGRGICAIEGKREAIAPYRFSVAMENAAADDYFSEKLVDCVLLETVPIYYGWPAAAAFLDARGLLTFSTREELAIILDQITPELYETMRPFVRANKERIIAKRWHNHAGMLERLSEALVTGGQATALALPVAKSTLMRRIREVLSKSGLAN